jgi:RNA polymerase sigma factor (sigma-70 family)
VLTDQLYRDHGRLVGGLCRPLLRDRAEAEDATQQVFLAAHRALLHGTSPREPAAWLAAIARNECWARIRLRMREPLPRDDVDDVRSVSDPLAEAIRNADLAAMWIAIAELPRLQRDALLLREFGGLSYEELAGALAVSGSAVESLLFRARQSMRARLKTVYAGLAGASWLDSVGRLVGGIGGGMAPVAAKVAAVGVGAAVATGGAVVAPRMLEHRQHNSPVSHLATTTTATPPAKQRPLKASQPGPVLVDSVQPAQVASTVRPATHERGGRGSGGDGRSRDGDPVAGGDDRSGPGGDSSGFDDSGEVRNASRSGSHHGGRREDASESGHGDDSSGSDGRGSGRDDGSSTGGELASSSGGGSGRDGSPDGGDSDDHGSGGHGSDGSGSDSSGSDESGSGESGSGDGGSNDGGVLTTTSNSVVTVTLSTVGNVPAGGGPQPDVGG